MSTRNRNDTSNWLCAVAALACTLGVGPTVAGPATGGLPQMTVNYADLDLSTPAGVEALYDRIKMASRKVCNALEGNPTHPAWRSCYLGTVSKAIATVDRPTLTALHKATRTAKG